MAQYDKYRQGFLGNPVLVRKATAVPPALRETEYSWLGRWSDIGWSIRIHPRLTPTQWDVYGKRAEECWDPAMRNYNPVKTMELLAALFPTHELVLKWPTCGKRLEAGNGVKGLPVRTICGAQAQHTEVQTLDVNGARVGIARCDAHRGQL